MTMEMYEAIVAAAAAGIPYNAAKPQITASNVRTGVCFACGKSGHQAKECTTKQLQHTKHAFIKPTSEQNQRFQAILRSEQAQQSGQPQAQSNYKKRGAEAIEARGAPAWKKSAAPSWVHRGTRLIAAASVESDTYGGGV